MEFLVILLICVMINKHKEIMAIGLFTAKCILSRGHPCIAASMSDDAPTPDGRPFWKQEVFMYTYFKCGQHNSKKIRYEL